MRKILAVFVLIGITFVYANAFAFQFESSGEDQKSIAVTVYNNNLGLVKDTRKVKMDKGIHEMKFMDVASQINPVTVHIKSLTTPAKLIVLEQNYEYDLLTSKKLLDKYVGKKVKLIDKNYYTGTEEIFDAYLLSNNDGPVYKINNEIYLNHIGKVVLPEVPENLIAVPTLLWLLDNRNPKAQDIEVSYLTSGINWKSDYIAVINQDNKLAELTGWVTLNNRSGTAYKNAKIKLVAGEVNRIVPPQIEVLRTVSFGEEPDKSHFKEESFFEYHLYTLDRASTIKNNQSKQIELLQAVNIPVKERLIYYGANYYFRSRSTGRMRSDKKIGVFLEIENKKENNLGIPLPAGIIRAYKEDSQGSLQFIGEDKIDHTPKDEKIKIKMGNAFDILGKRKQVDYKILSKNAAQRFDTEQKWQITVSNHKDRPVAVEVIEPIPGDWVILKSSHSYEKIEAHTIKFVLDLKANETQTVDYQIKIRFY
ncbi:MAG: DUF4139 domain-containing protein [Candidatus Omnitrophota bacterium]|nr:MAG: DUF4139 domain-containing protein [Candidatus Omnitrophota bacterium]